MDAFIKSYSLVAPGFNCETRRWKVIESESTYLTSQNPDYKQFFNPLTIRRLSRFLKNGSYAARQALLSANLDSPDAIIIGTGYGCFEDTINFLDLINENSSTQLNPTPFIQSTHNSISSLIALQLKCHGYNISYSHGSLSFECAMSDTLLHLEENPGMNILCGSADEINESLYQSLISSFGLSADLCWGEVFSMFVIGSIYSEECMCRIKDIDYSYNTSNIDARVHPFLEKNNLKIDDFDLILSSVELSSFKCKAPIINWKKITGECMTSITVPIAMASELFKKHTLPDILKLSNNGIRNILIINSYLNSSSSIILLSAC